MTPSGDIARLIEIMAALRTPETGCPWDLQQTFATIAPYTIEEAYEVADAIARGDVADLKDELGDLLLQVVYHARMAEEQAAFAFPDVVRAITAKMIRRHPHVFGGEIVPSSDGVKGLWAQIKAGERAAKAAERALPSAPYPGPLPAKGHGEDITSLLDHVPIGLPALTRAVKLQDKAAAAGFDWPSLAPVFDKLKEELLELEDVALPLDPRADGADSSVIQNGKIEEEFGDLLFVIANVARHLKLDPEAALRRANAKFIKRFGHIEQRLADDGRSPHQSSLEEMDALWDEAKRIERGQTRGG